MADVHVCGVVFVPRGDGRKEENGGGKLFQSFSIFMGIIIYMNNNNNNNILSSVLFVCFL